MAESRRGIKEQFWLKVKEESEKVGLRLNIQKPKIMASGPIASWQIEKQWKQCQTSFSWSAKSWWMVATAMKLKKEKKRKESLLLRRQTMTNLDSILKGRDLTLPTRVRLIKAMNFPVVMYGCKSRTKKKKAERQRTDAFELWCWGRLLRAPWTARRSNQSILKEMNPSVHWKKRCWSWSSNALATWCEEPTHWKRAWCWERSVRRVYAPRFCLITTKIRSDGHQSPWSVAVLGSWTDWVIALGQISATAPCHSSLLFR